MTAVATEPPPAPSDPRRILVADVVGRLAGRLEALGQRYEAAAGLAEGPLREALLGLAQRKRLQAADLAPLAASLGLTAPATTPSGSETPARPGWGVLLGGAFGAERSLETAARELGALTQDPAVAGVGVRLAAAAARDQAAVRTLYLRYT